MENSKEMSSWLHDFGLDHPLVIAGPCSAETEDQVLKIAHELKDTDVTVYQRNMEAQNSTWYVRRSRCHRSGLAQKSKGTNRTINLNRGSK